MKVLITGATGLVGTKLVDYLLNQGFEINILTHSKNKISEYKTTSVKSFYWNIESNEIDVNCFNEVDAIIHLAGATISKRWTKQYKNTIINSRVDSTTLLFKSVSRLKTHQIKHFITASAIGIYPNSQTIKYTEDYNGKSNFFLAQVVEMWENAANLFKSININVSKIRTGLVLDATSGAFPLMATPTKYYLGTNFGSGNQIYSWIHVDDLVRVYVFVLKNKLEGTYNAVASNPVSCKQFMQTIAKNVKTNIWLPSVPAWLLKAIMGEMAHLLIDGQYVVNNKIKNEKFTFVYDDLNEAIKNCLS